MGLVNETGAPECQRPGSFDKTFLVHKAAANVGMDNQRIGRAVWVLDAGDVSTL